MDIVICATQRCGSTLFIEDMRNAEVLGRPEEWFLQWNSGKADAGWRAELDGIYSQATGQNGISSVKIMVNQLHLINKCLSSFMDGGDSGMFPCVAEAFSSAAWVWIRREDVVSQAISRLMAQQTKVYHATGSAKDKHFAGSLMRGYDNNYNTQAEYRFKEILIRSTEVVLENLIWERFFEANKISPMTFVYEEVIADNDMSHLDDLARKIGLSEPVNKNPRKMVKLGNAKNAAWRDRFLLEAAATAGSFSKQLQGQDF